MLHGTKVQRRRTAHRQICIGPLFAGGKKLPTCKPGPFPLNGITAQKAADGSVTVQFGGCDGKVANCLPVMPGWNYMVRLYRPRAEVLNGQWKFPEAQPAG